MQTGTGFGPGFGEAIARFAVIAATHGLRSPEAEAAAEEARRVEAAERLAETQKAPPAGAEGAR